MAVREIKTIRFLLQVESVHKKFYTESDGASVPERPGIHQAVHVQVSHTIFVRTQWTNTSWLSLSLAPSFCIPFYTTLTVGSFIRSTLVYQV